jgi:uncharacterized protein YidB (DUF937 family)
MSLLDLAGQMVGIQQGGEATLMSTVLSLINNHPGGLPGLVSAFQQQGFAEVVNSWVSTGLNKTISPQQVQNVLGDSRIQDLASKLGISIPEASMSVAQMLPRVIDHLTPNGQMPASGSNILALGMGLLQNFGR